MFTIYWREDTSHSWILEGDKFATMKGCLRYIGNLPVPVGEFKIVDAEGNVTQIQL